MLYISVKVGEGERWIAQSGGPERFFAFYQEDELDALLASASFTPRESWLDADSIGRPDAWIGRLAEATNDNKADH
jgi:hypothetical protein